MRKTILVLLLALSAPCIAVADELLTQQETLQGLPGVAFGTVVWERGGLKEEEVKEGLWVRLVANGVWAYEDRELWEGDQLSYDEWYDAGSPYLQLMVWVKEDEALGVFAYDIHLALYQRVLPYRNVGLQAEAATWERRKLDIVNSEGFLEMIREDISELTKAFVKDFQAVNEPAVNGFYGQRYD